MCVFSAKKEKRIFKKITKKECPNRPKPNSAPDLVDCTRCDTPIAAPAKSKPGPNFLIKDIIQDLVFDLKFFLLCKS